MLSLSDNGGTALVPGGFKLLASTCSGGWGTPRACSCNTKVTHKALGSKDPTTQDMGPYTSLPEARKHPHTRSPAATTGTRWKLGFARVLWYKTELSGKPLAYHQTWATLGYCRYLFWATWLSRHIFECQDLETRAALTGPRSPATRVL